MSLGWIISFTTVVEVVIGNCIVLNAPLSKPINDSTLDNLYFSAREFVLISVLINPAFNDRRWN